VTATSTGERIFVTAATLIGVGVCIYVVRGMLKVSQAIEDDVQGSIFRL